MKAREYIELGDLLRKRSLGDVVDGQGRDWQLILRSDRPQAYRIMKWTLEPILAYAAKGARDGKLKVTLEGQFPVDWKKIFRRFPDGNADAFDTKRLVAGPDAKDVPTWMIEEFWDDDY